MNKQSGIGTVGLVAGAGALLGLLLRPNLGAVLGFGPFDDKAQSWSADLGNAVINHAKEISHLNWLADRGFFALALVVIAVIGLAVYIIPKLWEMAGHIGEAFRRFNVVLPILIALAQQKQVTQAQLKKLKSLAPGKKDADEEDQDEDGKGTTGPTLAEQVTELKKLKDAGTLNQGQFDAAVAKLTGTPAAP